MLVRMQRIKGGLGYRELLTAFECSSYVGYTATPFANIFVDPDAKQVLMPFPGLKGDPADRVHKEEKEKNE